MSDQNPWPETPNINDPNQKNLIEIELFKAKLERSKIQYQAEIDRQKEDRANFETQRKAEFDHYYAMFTEIQKGYLEVSKATIDRSIQRADFLQKVAASVVTIYTGILALTYTVDKSKGVALSFTGVIPAFFLGLSFLLSAVYVSFITKSQPIKTQPPDGSLMGTELRQRKAFILWNNSTVLKRAHLLQASVISLGIAIFFLPVPYIKISDLLLWVAMGIGLGLIIIIPLIMHLLENKKKVETEPDNLPQFPPLEAK